jgi:hypothetical protein
MVAAMNFADGFFNSADMVELGRYVLVAHPS